MNKRGQFYLVAAIIIIGVVFGLFSTKSYIKTEGEMGSVKIYDLSNELKEEGARVIDYGIYNKNKKIDDFVQDVATKYLGEKVQDITFIYGDKGSIQVKRYEETEVGTISTGPGMGVIVKGKDKVTLEKNKDYIFEYESGSGDEKIDKVKIIINNTEQSYDFTLKSGENFYIIIEKDIESEIYIEKR